MTVHTTTRRLALCVAVGLAGAETSPAAVAAQAAAGATMWKLAGVWVEGQGYDVTYGGDYGGYAQRCLATPRCVMIEYYRPEKKCNLYDALRPRKNGGSSDVAIRK